MLRLRETECSDLPVAMAGSQCVLLQGAIYVGGGVTSEESTRYSVMQYTPSRDEWSLLPKCPVKFFGLIQYNGRLHTVGGMSDNKLVSRDLYSFHPEQQKWTKPDIPSMLTKRYLVTAVSYGGYIAVFGGLEEGSNDSLATVEVFGGDQWLSAPPLPHPCFNMKAAVVGSKCYLLGGFIALKEPSLCLLSIHLQHLFSTARPRSATVVSVLDRPTWQDTLECPHRQSAVVGLAGAVLTIGGHGGTPEASTCEINAFSKTTRTWVPVGCLSTSLYSSSAVMLPGGEILVIGGQDKDKNKLRSVWTLSLQM